MSDRTLYLLDTNMVSYIANDRSRTARRTFGRAGENYSIATSTIVEGEIRYGLARKPEATRLRASVEDLFSMLDLLPWDSAAARTYGIVRAQLSVAGTPLSTIDTLIAAHALAVEAILVTHDKAFQQVPALRTIDWATDL